MKEIGPNHKALFGIPKEIKPIQDVPAGAKIRCRFRNNNWAKAFIRTECEMILCAIVEDQDGKWFLGPVQATNWR